MFTAASTTIYDDDLRFELVNLIFVDFLASFLDFLSDFPSDSVKYFFITYF